MKDVVLITCHSRPEFLFHCLRQIEKANGASELFYIFNMDYGHKHDLNTIIDSFPFEHKKIKRNRSPYPQFSQQSFHVLEGYKDAVNTGVEKVYNIEEDILISTDFFNYHQRVHELEPDLFCSISVKNHNRKVDTTNEINKYYLTTFDYCSWGVCFKSKILKDKILPYANQNYYKDLRAFCNSEFPNSQIGNNFCEQDGLIRRIQERDGAPIAYPHIPRAYHSGFYGYNRKKYLLAGTLNDKIKRLDKIIYSPEEMKKACIPGYYEDSEPVNLDLPECSEFVLENIAPK